MYWIYRVCGKEKKKKEKSEIKETTFPSRNSQVVINNDILESSLYGPTI